MQQFMQKFCAVTNQMFETQQAKAECAIQTAFPETFLCGRDLHELIHEAARLSILLTQ